MSVTVRGNHLYSNWMTWVVMISIQHRLILASIIRVKKPGKILDT